jgi:hypothetical protein
MNWVQDIGATKIVTEVFDARKQLRYDSGLAQDVEFANRSTTVNLTDSTGYSRTVGLTGQNILDAEQLYVQKVSNLVRTILLRWDVAVAYFKGLCGSSAPYASSLQFLHRS